jgi:uncharacterized membrane protein
VELGAPYDIELGVAADINDDGHIVGYGRERQNPFTTNVSWILRGNQLQRLNFSGWAKGINGSDQAALVVFDGTHGTQAGIYANDTIGIFLLRDANGRLNRTFAFAINAAGTVAGTVTPHANGPGEVTNRAAIFSGHHAPVTTFDAFVAAQHGTQARDINDNGQVLVEANVGAFSTRAVLWQPADGSWHFLGDSDTNVKPVALTNDGVVLGNSQNPAEAVVCSPGGAWTSLGTDTNWTATDINDSGDAVGIMTQDDMFRPWLKFATGQIVMLPHIAGHHTSANAINAAGQIVGGAQADHGGHAVIWRRK